eukprot:3872488-Rhodomonas_salina.1
MPIAHTFTTNAVAWRPSPLTDSVLTALTEPYRVRQHGRVAIVSQHRATEPQSHRSIQRVQMACSIQHAEQQQTRASRGATSTEPRHNRDTTTATAKNSNGTECAYGRIPSER